MRVAVHTTIKCECGIADYCRDLIAGLPGGVEAVVVPIPPAGINPLPMWAIGRRLNRADVVHLHHNYGFWGRGTISYAAAFATLQKAIAIPVVLTAHSVFETAMQERPVTLRRAVPGALGFYGFMDRGTYEFADRVIVHSRLHRRLLAARGIPAERLVEIMPGVPELPSVPPQDVLRFRATWKLHGKRVVGLFGFIQPNKNCELLICALCHLPPDVVLLLSGGVRTDEEEWYADKLRDLMRALGVENRVRITGFLSRAECAVALAATDLFVIPYRSDNSVSYSVSLCLAAHKPILASAVDAFEELRERFGCLEVFKSEDPFDLAQHIQVLLSDESRLTHLVEAARAYCAERNWRSVAAETVEVYRSVLKRKA